MEPTAMDWAAAREDARRRNEATLAPRSATGHWRECRPGDDLAGAPYLAATIRHTGFDGNYRTYERDKLYRWVEVSDGECVYCFR